MAERILHTIRRRPYQRGEQLPTVATLASTFAVTSHTVREALNQLEALGLIQIRHGSGIYVQRDADKLVFLNPFSNHIGLERCLDLLHTRLLLEPPLSALAAENASDTELNEMAATLREAEAFLSGTHATNERLNALNLRFHCLVAQASGNTVASEVVDVLAHVYSEEQLALLPLCEAAVPDYTRADHRGHEAILEALRAHDGALARQRMTRHIQGVRDILANHLSALGAPAPHGEGDAAMEAHSRTVEGR